MSERTIVLERTSLRSLIDNFEGGVLSPGGNYINSTGEFSTPTKINPDQVSAPRWGKALISYSRIPAELRADPGVSYISPPSPQPFPIPLNMPETVEIHGYYTDSIRTLDPRGQKRRRRGLLDQVSTTRPASHQPSTTALPLVRNIPQSHSRHDEYQCLYDTPGTPYQARRHSRLQEHSRLTSAISYCVSQHPSQEENWKREQECREAPERCPG